MTLSALLLAPFIGSVIAAFLPANARNREAWLAGAIALFGLVTAVTLYTPGQVLYERISWVPSLGLEFTLRMDGLAWVFAMLVLSIGLLVVLYARYYMSSQDLVPRFFSFLLAFMGAMLGVVLSGNLIQLVVFWELTSLTSFLLIAYWHHRADARRGARMAFTVTATGGLCLLAGVLILGQIVGSYDLDKVLASKTLIQSHELYLPALILIALGALTKSAQFPFHFWLPHAMAAPTPVSAYLHSATMVKAGVFLLMRLWPALAGTEAWTWIVAGTGTATLLIGAFAAIFQRDMKGLLAYSTISHLGLITTLLGIGTPLAMVAAIFHTLNHATFKASLFMAVGIIDHETGTRDMRVLRGLFKKMPYTATLAIVASSAMAGVPLLNGFISKEMFFAETLLVGGDTNWWMSYAALAVGVFGVIYALRFIAVFFGRPTKPLEKEPHEPPRWMRVPVELLVVACLIVGIAPAISIQPILHEAVIAVLGAEAPSYSLAVWHGLNVPLFMSLLALLVGALGYTVLRRHFGLNDRESIPVLHRLSGAQAYENTMLALGRAANFLLRNLGTERLQPQMLAMVAALIVVPAILVGLPSGLFVAPPHPIDPYFLVLWVVGGVCAIATAWQAKYHRLAALILVSGVGVATSITFLWLSAPDLALTQFMVETVTTILILLGLRWLPPRLDRDDMKPMATWQTWSRRSRDLVLAVGGGIAIALLSYAVLVRPMPESIAGFFLEKALPQGGGTNAVNVLLVDFRGFDTLGEITVICVVALTVYALLRRFRPATESITIAVQAKSPLDAATRQTPEQQANSGYLLVPGMYMRLLLPFMTLTAIYFFLRGHNLPGGGFVAGLIFSVAIIVQYMLAGTHWVETHLHLRPHRWLSYGLIIASTTGLGAWIFGYPFLTSHTAHLTLPVIGELHVPSAFVFDLGVFITVVGCTMLILVALGHQSIRSHRPQDRADNAAGAH